MAQKKQPLKFPAKLQKNLSSIENRLKKPVDQKTFQRLFQKLQSAQEECLLLKSQYTSSALVFLSDQEERICSLFGKVMNTHVNSEVSRISHAAERLHQGDIEKATCLQKEIDSLKQWHRPSKENLIKLSLAEGKISEVITKTPKTTIQAHLIVLSEEIENLLQLASFVYNKNKLDRNKMYASLSWEAKNRLNKHLVCLKTTAFEKEESTIQALFASAFEFAGIAMAQYPSKKEIQDFFSEEQKILEGSLTD